MDTSPISHNSRLLQLHFNWPLRGAAVIRDRKLEAITLGGRVQRPTDYPFALLALVKTMELKKKDRPDIDFKTETKIRPKLGPST